MAIKINAISGFAQHNGPESELAMVRRISEINPRREGWHFVRKIVDSFAVDGAHGKHVCLTFEPLREPLWLYCRRFVSGAIPSDIVKILL